MDFQTIPVAVGFSSENNAAVPDVNAGIPPEGLNGFCAAHGQSDQTAPNRHIRGVLCAPGRRSKDEPASAPPFIFKPTPPSPAAPTTTASPGSPAPVSAPCFETPHARL